MMQPVPATAASAYPGAESIHARSYAQYAGAVPAISWDDYDDGKNETEEPVFATKTAPRKPGRPRKALQGA